jgi:hypothetical protein
MAFDKKKYKEMIEELKKEDKYIKREPLAQERAEKWAKKKFKTPKIKGKISYKSSSPLKGLLKTKKETVTIKGGSSINLMKPTW